jgi:hypothetical protein
MTKRDEIENYFSTIRRCTKCILPETFPGIEFDDDGVCNYCHSHHPITVLGEQELKKTLSRYKDKGDTYDCVVPLSGGRDSTFVLHQMVTKYKMHVLTITVDSGFMRPEGIRNIETATKILNVDHVWLRNPEKIRVAQENCKRKFHGWLQNPSINTIVPVLNSGDKTMNLQMFSYAHDHGIPVVMGGNNIGNSIFEQEHWKTGFLGVFPNERGYYAPSDRLKLSFLFGVEYLRNPTNFSFPIFKEYFKGASVYFFESFLKPNDVDTLGFYDYIYWDEKKILSTILKETGWKGATDTTATWRVDDSAYPLINYMYHTLVGFTEHDELYSKMIREGQLVRKEALQRCLSDQKPRLPSLQQTFEELDVTKEQVNDVLEKYRTKLLRRIKGEYQ